ncbi:putative TonB-dependent receptor [Burkholderiales bacterium]|nr:putative TonB-dependent receptor [Burkholderiales bacterium]
MKEIVITATRHEEVLSKVPVSVSAFSQETMDLKGVKDFTEIARYTPGVTIDATGTGNNSISIRGISSSGGSGTTGIYIDDTPIQMHSLGFNADDTLPKTFDLERVEVLRGPQGTLFGAGSEGGTVRYIMTQPNMHTPSVYARSEVAFTEGGAASYEAGIAGGAPIIDGTLGVRASIWYRHDGGWIDRIDPFTLQTVQNNANYEGSFVGRLAAKWAVTPDLTVTPSLMYQSSRQNDISVFWPTVTGANGQTLTSDPGSHRFLNADPSARPEPDHYWLPAIKIETEVGGASLISNTSYYDRSDESGYEGTLYNLGYYQTVATLGATTGANQIGTLAFQPPGSSCPGLTYPLPASNYPLIDQFGLHLPPCVQNYRSPATVVNDQKVFTQEIRLQSEDPAAPLTWTTGIFYQFSREISLEDIFDPMVDTLFQSLFGNTATGPNGFGGSCGGVCPLVQGGYSYYNYNTGSDHQIAAFGEVNYNVTDRIKLTAGARVARTKFSFTHYADGPQNGGPTFSQGTQDETPFTPKLGVSFQADRNNLYYATFAKGFRTGGDNAPIPQLLCPTTFATLGLTTPSSPSTYQSDSVKSYEIGAKNILFDSLRLASSVYYIDWSNIQQNVYLPGCGFQFTTNVGQAVAKGFDLQADWSATKSLTIESAIGYTNARYTQDASLAPGGAPIAKSGDAVVGDAGTAAPPWTVTIGANYAFAAFELPSFVRIDYTYQSKSHFLTAAEDSGVSPTVYDPFAYTPPATTYVSLRAGTTYHGWNVSGFIDNLFDTHPLLPPGGPNSHSDADPNAPPGQGVLVRNYTFRPRTFGVTMTYRFN